MSDDPFVTLGLTPSDDPAALKRAYFAALRRHPPHVDPEGFQRVRAAYEHLSEPGRLAAQAWAQALDLEATRRELDLALEPRLAVRRRELAEADAALGLRARLERALLETSWRDLITRR